VSVQNTYTCTYSPLADTAALHSESHEFNFQAESHPFWLSFLRYYNFLSETANLLQTTKRAVFWWVQWAYNKYWCLYNYWSVCNSERIAYRAECSLCDADSHFFSHISPCSLLNICITNPEQIARDFRIFSEKRSSRFKQNWNIISVRAWEFETRKSKEWLENDFQTPGLYRIDRVEEQPTYNDCASAVLTGWRERKLKEDLHTTFIHKLQEIKTHAVNYLIVFLESLKEINNF
jgi:hypothetical protein